MYRYFANKELVNKGIVEHVSHGFYWLIDEENGKPENYQFIEACMVNPRAVICADSACYFHGLIDKMPETLSVATLKTDRSRMQLNFPVCRSTIPLFTSSLICTVVILASLSSEAFLYPLPLSNYKQFP